jgi:hypothetical protein
MNEYQLNQQQRDSISADDLAMLILRVLQRNHRDKEKGVRRVGYYEYQLSSILEFEIASPEGALRRSNEQLFRQKFAEAVHVLQHGGFIMQDPEQTHAPDFQRPTSKGLHVDTTAPVLGITSGAEFIRKVEANAVKFRPL